MRRNLGAIISVLFIVIIGLLLVFVNINNDSNSINSEKKEVLVGNYFEFDDDIVVTKGNDNVKINGNKIEFVKTGEVEITVKDKKYLFNVRSENKEVEIDGVTLDKHEITLIKGNKKTLKASISPKNASNKSIIWTSKDSNVASVNNGKIVAKNEGTTIITAMSGNGKSDTCVVIVKEKPSSDKKTKDPIEVKKIILGKTKVNLKVGESEEIRYAVEPSNANDKTLTWKSDNTSVVKVNNNHLTAVGEGTAHITVTSSNGKSVKIVVNVKNISGGSRDISVSSVIVSKKEITMKVGASVNITATVKPDNATDKTIKWTSGNEKIAKVDQNGMITAIKSGTVTITAKASNGKKDSCKVTVFKSDVIIVSISKIVLNKTQLNMKVGQSEKLSVSITPTDATNKKITWSSSNEKVATVKNGLVTAVKVGTAKIIAKTSNGLTAICEVSVSAKSSDKAIASDGTINNKYFGITASNNADKTVAKKNTNGINAAITYANNNGIKNIKLKKGTYYVANVINTNDGVLNAAIQLKSNINFNLNGSTIKMYPNSDAQYNIILIYNAKNAKVFNGTLYGDREKHTCMNGKSILKEDKRVGPDARNNPKCKDGSKGDGTHEWGMGVRIRNSSSIEVHNLILKEMTGDGVAIGNTKDSLPISTKNIKVYNNEIYKCRRQGITIGRVEGLKIYSNNIHNIKGTNPQAGIDVEPDGTKNYIIKTEIYNNKFSNNGIDFSSYNVLTRCTTKDEVNINIHNNSLDCSEKHTVSIRESLRKSFTLSGNSCQKIEYTGSKYVKCK